MSAPSPNITMKPEPRPSLLHRIPDATAAEDTVHFGVQVALGHGHSRGELLTAPGVNFGDRLLGLVGSPADGFRGLLYGPPCDFRGLGRRVRRLVTYLLQHPFEGSGLLRLAGYRQRMCSDPQRLGDVVREVCTG